MTSKHCFFKMMRENFRHKLWMLALSVLGNMLAIPVVYLISADYREGTVSVKSLTYQVQTIEEFFGYGVLIFGGVIAVTGALIAGLSGFRYVFHRNMTDTWHSIPVRRRTLFWVNWLNGFLIWFVPFLASMGLTLLLGLGRLGSLRGRLTGLVLNEEERILVSGWTTGGKLAANAFISLLALTVAFLLVYHIVLLAVMLCGNILNTLVTVGTLGIGAFVVYYLFIGFCTEYFDTFVYAVGNEGVTYASPLVSSIMLLYRRAVLFDNGEALAFWWACIANLVIAVALGALAFLAYLRRPSELAEQGLRMKPVRFLLQIVVSLASALGGWMLFYLIGDSMLIWGIFGAVLAGSVSFGVMDIVFRMEFRAFFAHKVLMGVTVAAGVFIGLLFYYDWLGYDRYLPDKEEIAEIAVYNNIHSNGDSYGYNIEDEMHPLNQVHIRDREAAHAFLESVTDRRYAERNPDLQYDTEYMEEVFAKVTLNSGRTYYRRYQVSSFRNDPACVLFTTPEYLDVNFKLGDKKFKTLVLQRGDFQWQMYADTQEGAELLEAVREAYDRDLEENPEAFIRGDGRLLCYIRLFEEDRYSRYRYLEVFEGMEHTREALREQGFGWFAEPVDAEDIQEIRLGLGYLYQNAGDSLDLVETAREVYGVRPGEEAVESERSTTEISRETLTEPVDTGIYIEEYVEEEYELHITDKAEIRELLELISYDVERYYNGGVFRPDRVEQVTIVLSEEEKELFVNIPVGTLPEKYILRFKTLQP